MLTTLIGLDLGRYKSWEQKDTNPKYEDRVLIEAFFGMPLDEITKLDRIPKELIEKKGRETLNKEERATVDKYLKEKDYLFWRFLHIFF